MSNGYSIPLWQLWKVKKGCKYKPHEVRQIQGQLRYELGRNYILHEMMKKIWSEILCELDMHLFSQPLIITS